jgi:hypothetical protein
MAEMELLAPSGGITRIRFKGSIAAATLSAIGSPALFPATYGRRVNRQRKNPVQLIPPRSMHMDAIIKAGLIRKPESQEKDTDQNSPRGFLVSRFLQFLVQTKKPCAESGTVQRR